MMNHAITTAIHHSDPTYEAWKPSIHAVIHGLLILHSDPTYEAWKLYDEGSKFFIVCNSDPTYEAWKRTAKLVVLYEKEETPILPMRHGNWGSELILSGLTMYSDPTYEAWKQQLLSYFVSLSETDSDPTYEAWKQDLLPDNIKLLFNDSDPTYEAWKP